MASRYDFFYLVCIQIFFTWVHGTSFSSFPEKKPCSRFLFSLVYRTATGGGVAWHNFINAEFMAFMSFSCILRASASFFNECFELA